MGEIKNGSPDGFGIQINMTTSEIYTGQWKNGLRCGKGIEKDDAGNEYIGNWKGVRFGNLSGAEVRRDYINTHVVILQALGIAGRDLMEKYPDNWKKKLKKLKDIDWQKRNKIWDQRVIVNGRVVKNNKSIIATVGSKSKYPFFYNAVVSKRISDEIK